MNLTCPSCDTTFHIDQDQIGPAGRRVRCGSCGHDWVQPRLEEEAPAPTGEAPGEAPGDPPGDGREDATKDERRDAAPAPEPEAPAADQDRTVDLKPAAPAGPRERGRNKARAAAPPRASGGRTAAGWIVFLLVVGALTAGAYFGRAQIVAAVPAAAEIYRLAGLPVEPPLGEGLELREVKSVRRLIDGQRVVVIEGLVANVSDRPREVPRLRASLTDAAGAQVDEWVFSANAANLPPGGVTQFETSTRNAPREGSLGIDFVASR